MSKILIGALQPGARPINQGITGAVRGVAMFDGIPRGVIAKHGTLAEIAAECFCALFAKDLHLDAPECGLVLNGSEWWFASIDVGAPNLTQIFTLPKAAIPSAVWLALAQELVAWPKIGRLLAFDVLIRNADRNTGNLLSDGEDWWLIDHARSMELWTYSNHKLYQLIKSVCDAATADDVLARTEAQSITFAVGSHVFAATELQNDLRLSPFSGAFGEQIVARQPGLATSIRGLL